MANTLRELKKIRKTKRRVCGTRRVSRATEMISFSPYSPGPKVKAQVCRAYQWAVRISIRCGLDKEARTAAAKIFLIPLPGLQVKQQTETNSISRLVLSFVGVSHLSSFLHWHSVASSHPLASLFSPPVFTIFDARIIRDDARVACKWSREPPPSSRPSFSLDFFVISQREMTVKSSWH